MQHSRAITKKSASNLALAFILLPREKRDAMAALYAFCRAVDDVADEDSVPTETRRELLAAWRKDILRATHNELPELILNREFQPVIQKFHLPFVLFDELIKGCEMDLDTLRYENYDQLELYCHRVASVVGLLSIEIFGYQNPACHDYAVHLGKALQLTNILRDVKNDAARGRIYLPLAELKKFNVTEAEILNSRYSENYFALATSVAARAKYFYQLAKKNVARRRPQIHGRRRADGFGLLATIAKTRSQSLQCFRPAVGAPEQAAQARAHSQIVAASRVWGHGVQLWRVLKNAG